MRMAKDCGLNPNQSELRGIRTLFPLILICASFVDGSLVPRFPIIHRKLPILMDKVSSKVAFKTSYFKQPVDHFSFSNADNFLLRYLVADQYWDRRGGPIFFYTGNEGDIVWFCNNTGFMWDIAPKYKAMLIFAEHRYYGKSMPYGAESYKDPKRLGYLTSEQALGDFADLIVHVKSSVPGAASSPVIAMGGSYGGMLAAWLRMKYPQVVAGSLAASAPVWQFDTPCNKFYQIVTKDFEMSGPHCADVIRKSWSVINNLATSADGRAFMSVAFKLCQPLKTADDVALLKAWLSEMWVNLAMVDYPYPASFLEPLPAWPVKAVCKYLSVDSMTDDVSIIIALGKAATVYYNYTGQATCLNTTQQATSDLGAMGWYYQACTEMIMPMCADGVNDMFEPSPWNLTAYLDDCYRQWGVRGRPDWVITEYGGRNIKAASNIIFSNGKLDPWSSGGVTESLSSTLTAVIIEEGAHHLDLRAATTDDPPSLKAAREKETQIISKWISDYQDSNKHDTLRYKTL